MEFGIGSSGMKYEEWNNRGVNEVSGKIEFKPSFVLKALDVEIVAESEGVVPT